MRSRTNAALRWLLPLLIAPATGCGDESEQREADGANETSSEENDASAQDFRLSPESLYAAYIEGKQFIVPVRAERDVRDWRASVPAAVVIEPLDARAANIHIRAASKPVRIIATSADGKQSSALLTITSGTPDAFELGRMRYNNGKPAIVEPQSEQEAEALSERIAEAERNGLPPESVLYRRDAACNNCHGDASTIVDGRPVRHTPAQIGGYSDDEVIDVITRGLKPGRRPASDRLGTPGSWASVHSWEVTADEARGLVLYLRALTPRPQEPSVGMQSLSSP
jgi:hypothetical protein